MKCYVFVSCYVQVFEDAYRSPVSIIVLDDIERLIVLEPRNETNSHYFPCILFT